MINTARHTITDQETLTLEHVLNKIKQLNDDNPKKDEWVVITPEGVTYVGKYDKILKVMLARHPVFSEPFTPLKFTNS